jgi:hypothetical protein
MIPLPAGCRVCTETSPVVKRRGMRGLALQDQEQLKSNLHIGYLYIFGGHSGNLAKMLWFLGWVIALCEAA